MVNIDSDTPMRMPIVRDKTCSAKSTGPSGPQMLTEANMTLPR